MRVFEPTRKFLTLRSAATTALVLTAVSCGEMGTADTDDSTSTGTVSSTVSLSSGAESTTTTADSTDVSSGTRMPEESSSSGSGGASSSLDATDGSSADREPAFDCSSVPLPPASAVPFPVEVDGIFDGTSAFAFRPSGELVVPVFDGFFVAYDSEGLEVDQYPFGGRVNGLVIRSDDLVAYTGSSSSSSLNVRTPLGTASEFEEPIPATHLHVDSEDRIWISYRNTFDPSNDAIGVLSATGEYGQLIAGGPATGVEGMFFDDERQRLFFAIPGEGRVRSAALEQDGSLSSIQDVGVFEDVSPSELTMDVCNNLYMTSWDQVFRVGLDEGGVAVGDPEPILSTGANLSNIHIAFGRGRQFDPLSLYVKTAGVSGTDTRFYVAWLGVPMQGYTGG